jgi:hypothetical protein
VNRTIIISAAKFHNVFRFCEKSSFPIFLPQNIHQRLSNMEETDGIKFSIANHDSVHHIVLICKSLWHCTVCNCVGNSMKHREFNTVGTVCLMRLRRKVHSFRF